MTKVSACLKRQSWHNLTVMARLVLKELLRRKRISVRAFSRLINTDISGAFRAVRPDYNPTLKTMTLWAKALKCKVRDLIKE